MVYFFLQGFISDHVYLLQAAKIGQSQQLLET